MREGGGRRRGQGYNTRGASGIGDDGNVNKVNGGSESRELRFVGCGG